METNRNGRAESAPPEDLQRTDLMPYVPYVVVTTTFVVALPLLLAYGLSGPLIDFPFIVTTLLCTTLSALLGRLGARWWQSRAGARDVVFDDLTLWGFLRRLRQQRRVLTHAERLALTRSGSQLLSAQDHSRVLKKLARALETGDPYTHGHSDRVARHAYMVARTLKLPKRTCDKIRLAAALHDVGKLHTPHAILTKPGRLTDEEFETIKRHPGDGADMVTELRDSELTDIVRHHHERIDGTGYPHQISGDKIPLGARIISVVDTFDAITSRRPYRATRTHKDALAILRKEAGSQLDERVVGAFITYYTGRRGIRRWMSLTSGVPSFADFSLVGLRGAISNAAVAAVVVTGSAIVPGLNVRTEPPRHGTPGQNAVGAGTTSAGGGPTLMGTGSGANPKAKHQGPGSSSTSVKSQGGDGRPGESEKAGTGDGVDPAPQEPEDGGSDQSGGNEPGGEDNSGPGGGDNSGPGGGGNSGSDGGDNSGPGGGNSGPGGGNSGPGGGNNSGSDGGDNSGSDGGDNSGSGDDNSGPGGGGNSGPGGGNNSGPGGGGNSGPGGGNSGPGGDDNSGSDDEDDDSGG